MKKKSGKLRTIDKQALAGVDGAFGGFLRSIGPGISRVIVGRIDFGKIRIKPL